MFEYSIAAVFGAVVGMRRARSARRFIWLLDTDRNIIGDEYNFSQSATFVPAIAALGGIAGVALYWRFDLTVELFAFALLTSALITQSVVDATTHRLSRRVTTSTIMFGAPLLSIAAVVTDNPGRLVVSLACAVLLFIVFLLLWVLSRGGIGGGDVRLAIVMGMYLGWLGASFVFVAVIVASVVAGLVALLLLIGRRATRTTRLAFGPYLALGTMVSMMEGDWIARVWLGA